MHNEHKGLYLQILVLMERTNHIKIKSKKNIQSVKPSLCTFVHMFITKWDVWRMPHMHLLKWVENHIGDSSKQHCSATDDYGLHNQTVRPFLIFSQLISNYLCLPLYGTRKATASLLILIYSATYLGHSPPLWS